MPVWDKAVVQSLGQFFPGGVHGITTGLDCVAALRASGIERLLLSCPPRFDKAVVEAGVCHVTAHGLSPPDALSIVAERQWRDVAPGQLYAEQLEFAQHVEYRYRQIREGCPQQADGVLIAGDGVGRVGTIEALEKISASRWQRPIQPVCGVACT